MLSVLNPADYMWNHDGLDVIDGDPPSSLQVRKDIIKAIPMFLISLPPFAICLVFTLMWVHLSKHFICFWFKRIGQGEK